MPRNQFQRMIFALLTVIITVHGYVFYSLYVVNGKLLMELNGTNPMSFKMDCRMFNPRNNHPMIFETSHRCFHSAACKIYIWKTLC